MRHASGGSGSDEVSKAKGQWLLLLLVALNLCETWVGPAEVVAVGVILPGGHFHSTLNEGREWLSQCLALIL